MGFGKRDLTPVGGVFFCVFSEKTCVNLLMVEGTVGFWGVLGLELAPVGEPCFGDGSLLLGADGFGEVFGRKKQV